MVCRPGLSQNVKCLNPRTGNLPQAQTGDKVIARRARVFVPAVAAESRAVISHVTRSQAPEPICFRFLVFVCFICFR